jgi:hypothetical protein
LGEVLIVAYILFKRKYIVDALFEGVKPKLDILGVFLTVSGLAIAVKGVLMASTYGFFVSRVNWEVGGKTLIAAGGVSPTIILVLLGAIILALFVLYERRRERAAKFTLIHLEIFKNKILRGGLGSIFAQQFLLGGLMYSLALFLQVELSYDALSTGFTMLPLSLMILLVASRGATLSKRFAPKNLIKIGFWFIVVGTIWLGYRSTFANNGLTLAPTLIFVGAGVGIIASQLQNLVQSSVDSKNSAEASGLMATFQNLGMSLGTAISGVLMIGILIFTATNLINDSSSLNQSQKDALSSAYEQKGQIVSNAQIESVLSKQPKTVTDTVVQINSESRSRALSLTFVLMGIMSALGLISTRNLPSKNDLK